MVSDKHGQEWLFSVANALFLDLIFPKTEEIADVLYTFHFIAELPPDIVGAYIISMATNPSDILAVGLLQNRMKGKREVTIGYSDSGKDAGGVSAAWQPYKAQEELVKVAMEYGFELTMFHDRGGTVGKGGVYYSST
ncbi:hypothetical protein OIU84_016589 [Salix udensis]|uniref:Phosphoenolpyruvate carboxylase n=1 Tax=Salix udensis TaxID=889485 RepID=A0AAD6JAD5_9ROSI|nr:hypothetical protein OIU84_016589 [Salix udensis]